MSRVSVSSFISGLLGGPSEKKFAQAIEKHDLTAMKKCLDAGVRRIDYIQWRDGDYPGQKVPVGKFHDPVKFAKQVGMKQEGMALLAQYGLVDPEQTRQAAPRR